MRTKKFVARNMSEGLKKISTEFGEDAIILSNQKISGGVEILAAVEEHHEHIETFSFERNPESDIIKSNSETRRPLDKEHLAELLSAIGPLKTGTPKIKDPYDQRHASRPKKTNNIHSLERAQSYEPRQPSRTVQTDDASQELDQVRREINDLKVLLEQQKNQMVSMGTQQSGLDQQDTLSRRLEFVGINVGLRRSLLNSIPEGQDVEKSWRHLLGQLSARMETFKIEPIRKGGIYAFVGMTGAGKTTTLGKMATRYCVDHGPENLLLISLDQFRIGSQDPLRVLSKILHCDFEVLNESQDLEQILQRYKHKEFILIDTCGSEQGLQLFAEQVQQGFMSRKVRSLVMLPCTSQYAVLEDHLSACETVQLAGAVLTKTDESRCHGPAISLAIEHELPVAYWTDGQNIPEDLHVAKPHQLISQAVAQVSQRSGFQPDSYSSRLKMAVQ